MSVIYHNRTRLSVEREAGAKYVSLKELISQSDVISLNLALNESTRNILGKAEFAEMKTGVVIVNTARSGLVDTEAMIEALDSGKVCATFFASLSDLTCMMLNPTSTRD
jgi:D-3-phosphoglycerate dehydrogenase